ncbi:MAG: hypothetical protein II007_05940 [Gammaproteobacteria bacterium]|nr:hypothetical protein [Gammaproteobacteria bacterium]
MAETKVRVDLVLSGGLMQQRVAIWKAFVALLAIYGLALLPAVVVEGYLDSPMGILVLVPWLTANLIDALGLPGMLVNDGQCGWGWCSPTLSGWLVVTLLWLALAWFLAWALVVVVGRCRT